MADKKLIVLEGIDCSGKSMYSRMLTERLVKKFGEGSWIHEHEPTFSSQESDALNFSKLSPWRREYYFMMDRKKHQETLKENNVVLDRYILTGLAYAQTFGPEVISMVKDIYGDDKEFKHPDIMFFIDMEPMNALAINESRKSSPEYNPKLTLETLKKLRVGFITHIQTMREWGVQTITIQPFFGDIDRTFESILNWFQKLPLI